MILKTEIIVLFDSLDDSLYLAIYPYALSGKTDIYPCVFPFASDTIMKKTTGTLEAFISSYVPELQKLKG